MGTITDKQFKLVREDPYLEPFQDNIQARYDITQQWIQNIEKNEGSLEAFSRGYEKFGFQVKQVCVSQTVSWNQANVTDRMAT